MYNLYIEYICPSYSQIIAIEEVNTIKKDTEWADDCFTEEEKEHGTVKMAWYNKDDDPIFDEPVDTFEFYL